MTVRRGKSSAARAVCLATSFSADVANVAVMESAFIQTAFIQTAFIQTAVVKMNAIKAAVVMQGMRVVST